MSASERLRALDGALYVPAPWHEAIPNDAYVDHGEIATSIESALCELRTALPLIADAISAAEVVDEELASWEPTEKARTALYNSLLALEEALDARPWR